MFKKPNQLLALTALVLFLLPQTSLALPVSTEVRDIVVYGGKNTVSVNNLRVKENSSKGQILVVPGSELAKVKEKKEKGEIQAYGFREKYEVATIPNDPDYEKQWSLPKIDAPRAWDVTIGSNEVVVAVIDTGFQLNHPDLSAKFVAGYDFVDNDPDPSLPAGGGSRYSHGTSVAGVVAASSNNTVGIAGMNWGAKIMPIRVMGNDGIGYTDDIADGIDFARINGAEVVNLSLGYNPGLDDPDPVLEAAINNAYNAGITIVAASGNENTVVSYPAAFDNVIAVGASDQGDSRCDPGDWDVGYGSNYGPELDVVAPGNLIYTTSVEWTDGNYIGRYKSESGTSLASPLVAGLAGLLRSQQNYSPLQIAGYIKNAADKVVGMEEKDFTDFYGYGRINAQQTVAGISLNSFRITMENTTTPDNADDYVLADYPAVGEPVSVRTTLKNDNASEITLENIRVKGSLSSGTQFIVGTIPTLTLGANTTTAVTVQTFNITSFYVHTFSIDYELNGSLKTPLVKPSYSYQQIKAHYPNVKIVKTPTFSPSSIASYGTLAGIYKLKNYDSRPAYLKKATVGAKLNKDLYYFSSESPIITPGAVYYYQKSIIPYKKGIYSSYAQITLGNGATKVPTALSSVSSYGNFSVY